MSHVLVLPAANIQRTLKVIFSGILSTLCSRIAGTLAPGHVSVLQSSTLISEWFTLCRRIRLQTRNDLENVSILWIIARI
jgi:hypothetical protein